MIGPGNITVTVGFGPRVKYVTGLLCSLNGIFGENRIAPLWQPPRGVVRGCGGRVTGLRNAAELRKDGPWGRPPPGSRPEESLWRYGVNACSAPCWQSASWIAVTYGDLGTGDRLDASCTHEVFFARTRHTRGVGRGERRRSKPLIRPHTSRVAFLSASRMLCAGAGCLHLCGWRPLLFLTLKWLSSWKQVPS